MDTQLNKLFSYYAVKQMILDIRFIRLYVEDFFETNNIDIKIKKIIIDETYPYQSDFDYLNLILYFNPRLILDNIFSSYNLSEIDIRHINLCYLKRINHELIHLKQLNLIYNKKTNGIVKKVINEGFRNIKKNPNHYHNYYEIYPIEYNANVESILYLNQFMRQGYLFEDGYDEESYESIPVNMIISGLSNGIVESFYDSLGKKDKLNQMKMMMKYKNLRVYDKLVYGFEMDLIDREEIKKYIKK